MVSGCICRRLYARIRFVCRRRPASLAQVFDNLHRNAGPLAIIAVLAAIFGGSRLFITIENCFDLVIDGQIQFARIPLLHDAIQNRAIEKWLLSITHPTPSL
jgi:hypothetical protein